MTSSDKIYTTLVVLFSVLLVLANLIYQKFVSIPLVLSHTLELSIGTILYPLTFLVTDLITEFYGKEKANFCIYLAIGINVFIAALMVGMDVLEATPWSKVNDETFHNVFGLFNVAFIGSMIACYVAQRTDVYAYLWIRKLTGEKWLWLRNTGSTAISLFIDTSIMISFMVLFGILSWDHMGLLITNSYLYKFFFTIFSAPLFYLGYWTIQRLLGAQEVGEMRASLRVGFVKKI
jgi:uncharacterized integral membrane protein (TIGR00697 family)